MDFAPVITGIDVVARESALFAATGFLIGGLDDLCADLLYLMVARRSIPPVKSPVSRRFALLVPAWDESAVIAPMLIATLSRIASHDVRIYVGAYPNDPATIKAVTEVAAADPRVRLTIGEQPGPTTKGANLNNMWRALQADEAADDWFADTIVLHNAEDVIDPQEFAVFERFLTDFDYVQLPVRPLIPRNSRWVSAHYSDEFAEVHYRSLALRQRLGVGLPLAGVGCAIRRGAIDRVSATRGGEPFDPTSLTEDYELGLALAATGARGCFARVRDDDGRPVAVRAYFPSTLNAAVRQKARWMNGIALMGWDRLGWRGSGGIAGIWMRMRDRRAPLAMLVLAVGWFAMFAGSVSALLHVATGLPVAESNVWLDTLLLANSALLLWRLAMRGGTTGVAYGWREGVRAIPRFMVANLIGLFAARRAVIAYAKSLRGAPPQWDKTAHVFPAEPDRIG